MLENHQILRGKRFDLEIDRFYGHEPHECSFGHTQLYDEEAGEWYCPLCEWMDNQKEE